MTVSTIDNKIPYAGDGGTSVFPVTFGIFETSDLKLTKRSSAGTETIWTETSDYTVTITDPNTLPSVASVAVNTPPASGETLVIERDIPYTQETDLPVGGAFLESVVERVFDKLTMLCQQNLAKIDLTLHVPTSDSSYLDLELPSSVDRATKYLAFSASGEPIASAGPTVGGIAVSSYMETIIGSSSHAALLSNLGIDAISSIWVKDYASLAAAITAAGSSATTLIVDTAITPAASWTIPVTATLLIIGDGSITKTSTYTGTINGKFINAHGRRCFIGYSAGNITFGSSSCVEAIPEWWAENTAPGTTNMATAAQCAINSTPGVFLPSVYGVGTGLTLATNSRIRGAGKGISGLVSLANSITLLALTYGSATSAKVSISDLYLSAGTHTAVNGFTPTLANFIDINEVDFIGLVYNVLGDRTNYFNIKDCRTSGTVTLLAGKIFITDTSGSSYSQHVTIENYEIYNTGTGVQDPAILFRRVAPGYVINPKSNDLYAGSSADGICFDDDCQGCKIIGGIITKPNRGIWLNTHAASRPTFTEVIGTDVDQPQVSGLLYSAGSSLTVRVGSYTSGGAGVNAFDMNDGVFRIEGVEINSFAVHGVNVAANVTNFQIENNRIASCTGDAILVNTGSSDGYIITGNDCSIANGAKIVGTTTSSSKIVANNI